MTVAYTRWRRRLALCALAASAACSRAPQQEPPTPAAPRDAVVLSRSSQQLAGIEVEVAKAEPVAAALEAVGTVALDDTRTARVGALVEGVVDATRVNVGDRVRAGALLAGLHSHAVHDGWGDYRKAVADRRRVEQELAFASETVARTERLLADKAASVLEVERARSMRAGAVEQLAVANAEVQRARESLEHLGIPTGSTTEGRPAEIIPVRTPQGGVVLEKLVTTGTAVTPGTPLFVVSDTSSLWVLAEIDEAALAQVKIGAPVQMMVSAYPTERFPAAVTQISDTINPASRRVVVRCQVGNSDGRLKPGMFARVQLEGAAAAPTIHLPVDAVQDIGERRIVFVPSADGRYVARDVETGAERAGRVEIRRGVAVGDRVVVRGAFLLKSQLLASPEGES
ncbi:Cation efflux system protein CzcB [Luteitalea pratensis]|uniref:Cation efflux system protein CzcB n=1 Tax=Luteitalea pratensis TaxID=1855912 RepID=A0A143PF10_LUTPR|nr:efflux RND transporter periplasmic adaptor subunit [Luteitalea pratensis]AMY07127.1 Cation efflux system protein CzcB [Luteitalea pratensis]